MSLSYTIFYSHHNRKMIPNLGEKVQKIDIEQIPLLSGIFLCLLLLSYCAKYLSKLTNFTLKTKICAAIDNSSGVGKDGAIRILLSFGSFP